MPNTNQIILFGFKQWKIITAITTAAANKANCLEFDFGNTTKANKQTSITKNKSSSEKRYNQ